MTTRHLFGSLLLCLCLTLPALAQPVAPKNQPAPEASPPISGYFCGLSSVALVLLVVCYPVRRD